MTMKVFIVSFGTNPRIVAKFQTDRLTTYNDNRAGKKITPLQPHTIAVATLLQADAAASINQR